MKSDLKSNHQAGVANVAIIIAVVVLVAGAVAYFLTGGFGANQSDQPVKTAKEGGSNTTTDTKEESQKNDKANKSAEIADWIRDNYPIYPDSTISSVTEQSVAGANERYIIGTTAKGDGAEIASWYHEEYEKAGWAYDNVNTEKRFNASRSVDGSDLDVVINVSTTSVGSIVTITAQRIVR